MENIENQGTTENTQTTTGNQAQKTFTQSEVDAIIAQRMARFKMPDFTEEHINKIASQVGDKLGMNNAKQPTANDEQAQQTDSKDELLQKTQKLFDDAKLLRIQSALERISLSEGISAEMFPLLAKFIDISDVNVEGVNVDETVLKTKITNAIEQFPILKGTQMNQGNYSSGANPGGMQKAEQGSFGASLGKKVAQERGGASEKFKGLFK